MRSLWQFLHLMCVALTLGASMGSPEVAKAGFRGYAVATAVGLGVGVGCAWIMWNAGRIAFARIRSLPGSMRERYFRRVYIGAILWVILVAFFRRMGFARTSSALILTRLLPDVSLRYWKYRLAILLSNRRENKGIQ